MTERSILFQKLNITLKNVGDGIYIGGFQIAFYGMVIALGMLLAVILVSHLLKKQGLIEDDILDICIYAIVFGVIGARIYYVIFSFDSYKDNLLDIFNLRQGGLAIYGGVLGGVLAVLILCRIKKISFLAFADAAFCGVLVGQILGRFGNFFNREVFGGYYDGLFSMQIPLHAVRDMSDVTQEMMDNLITIDGIDFISVHPTFLYELSWNIGVLILMLLLYKRRHFFGENLCLYFVGYGIGRFIIEGIRTDQLILFNTGLPASQVLAVILIVVGILIFIWGIKKGQRPYIFKQVKKEK